MDRETLWKRLKPLGWTQQRLAEALDITQGAVGQWDRVPAERVARVAAITKIPARELRPDIFEGVA